LGITASICYVETAVLEEQSTSHWGCQLGSPSASSLDLHTSKQSTMVSFSLEKQTLYRQQDFILSSTKASQKPDYCVYLILCIQYYNCFSSDHL